MSNHQVSVDWRIRGNGLASDYYDPAVLQKDPYANYVDSVGAVSRNTRSDVCSFSLSYQNSTCTIMYMI
jgi:hypothetical protein